MGEYDDLLEEARSKAAAYMSTAKIYIPKMYNALINESKNISPEDARDRIEKDCIGIWSKRTILDALPDEAKNPEKQKSGRLGQKKRNFAAISAAKSSAPESPAPEIRLDAHGRSTDGESAIDESSKHRSKEQLKAKEAATEQDQASLAAEQEPLKQEVLVDRSGQGTVKPTRSPQEDLAKTQGSGNTHVTGKHSVSETCEGAVPPQPGSGIGIGGADQQPLCGYCPTKDFKITELEQIVKKKDHEIEQLNERIRKLEQKQKQSSVTFEFSVPLRPLCHSLIAAVDSKVADRFCFIGKLDIQSGKVIDVRYLWRGNQKESKI